MGKKKYSLEIKKEVVKYYLEIGSIKRTAERFDIHKGSIKTWVDIYREHGYEGLGVKNGSYTGDFKKFVVEYMINTKSSARHTAAYFNIPSHTSISNWMRIHEKNGAEALFVENRGASGKMKSTNTIKTKKVKKEEKDLLAEVEYLRMENAYLKKLNALVQEREKSDQKIK